jgi:methylase of polypeptide subunit release factors
MDFVDIEPTFLEQIKINLDLNHIDPSRYSLIRSDVFEKVPSGEKYDAIFANPPYIAETGKDSFVEDAVRDYEPHGALFAPDAGMELIGRTLRQVKDFLAPGGKLYMEHSDEQVRVITALLQTQGISWYTFKKDQFGLYRWLELS